QANAYQRISANQSRYFGPTQIRAKFRSPGTEVFDRRRAVSRRRRYGDSDWARYSNNGTRRTDADNADALYRHLRETARALAGHVFSTNAHPVIVSVICFLLCATQIIRYLFYPPTASAETRQAAWRMP